MTVAATTQVESTKAHQIIEELLKAYWMELETVQNYLANSVNLVGVRTERIKQALEANVVVGRNGVRPRWVH